MLKVENGGWESEPPSPLAEGQLEASRLGLAYLMENGNLPRPIGKLGASES